MKPRVSILSPDFKYVPAVSTDLARTFARIRREQRQRAEQQWPPDAADVVIGVVAKKDESSSLRLCGVPNHASRGGVTGKRFSHVTETEDSAIVQAASFA
jgi:hypothetical protein